MVDRKQFLSKSDTNPELEKLLKESSQQEVTEEDLKEQRISFAYGNALGSELITKDSVRHSSQKIRLK